LTEPRADDWVNATVAAGLATGWIRPACRRIACKVRKMQPTRLLLQFRHRRPSDFLKPPILARRL